MIDGDLIPIAKVLPSYPPSALRDGLEGSVIVSQVQHLEKDKGFDAQSETFVDMVKAGIIDPTKVARVALQNAASIAGLMLTTEALVSEIPEKRKARAAGMADDMGDY